MAGRRAWPCQLPLVGMESDPSMSGVTPPLRGPAGEPESLLWWAEGDHEIGEGARSRGSGWRPENMRKRGFAPATVIDVGAAYGTPALYAAFPDAYHVMIEPLADYEPSLR